MITPNEDADTVAANLDGIINELPVLKEVTITRDGHPVAVLMDYVLYRESVARLLELS